MVKDVQITFDCADPAALAAFWAEVLGYELQPPPGNFETWDAALELGLVDVKVAAIDPDWSGLKIVWRKENRT